MTVESQQSLEREVQRIYDEAGAYAKLHGGVEGGMNVLYGPPMLDPKVMIVSLQGGGKDGKAPQTTWPGELAYLDGRHEFGRRLVRDFDGAGLGHILRGSTVATNLAFPQASRFAAWLRSAGARGWMDQSAAWLERLLALMRPAVLLTYGKEPFERLTGRRKRNRVEETTRRGIPLIGCGHLIQGATLADRVEAISRVKKLIDSAAAYRSHGAPDQE